MSLSRGVLFLGALALCAAVGSATSCKKSEPAATSGDGNGAGTGGSATTSTGTGGSGGATGTGTTTGSTSTGTGGSAGMGGSGGSGGSGGAPCGGCPDGKVCDPGLGCMECFADTDCKDAGKPICVFGSCAECGTPFECDAQKVCSQYDHTCASACGSDTDCKNGAASHCDPTAHFCAECTADAPCPTQGGAISSCFNGRCVKCFTQAQCGGATPICDPSVGECVQCLANSQCGPGQACTDHTCNKK